ncbi:MAG: hypothetical protein L6R42_003538 [Xanthoria sp. 1 TBL-2021]|nr:MAG: hypothetical protein L6R42_003538 [Xanthoria sp. 1 TBL-2021]
MASSDPPTSRDPSPNSSTQNPPTRPPLDVSNLGLTLRDWETANYTLISLYRLLHNQANRSHEQASSSQAAPPKVFKDFSNETQPNNTRPTLNIPNLSRNFSDFDTNKILIPFYHVHKHQGDKSQEFSLEGKDTTAARQYEYWTKRTRALMRLWLEWEGEMRGRKEELIGRFMS